MDANRLEPAFYGGDPARGAALGRSSYGDPTGKVHLRRVRLDSGGYDRGGAYWGLGAPLYRAVSAAGDEDFEHYLRAPDREAAKAQLRAKHPGIAFLR